MEGDFIKINHWLTPLSWLYGTGVKLRNWCFAIGILKQRRFPLPIISVGNLTVGGCGKTPHTEYLVSLLHDEFNVAVLSRGYKRKSKGYILATCETPMPMIGDEPYQMKHKFRDVHVAVDRKRCHGIERLMNDKETSGTEVILLDDAYQHRYVKPGMNILLVDYHRLIIYDKLLPAGRLREPQDGKERADIVIITKCPDTLRPMDYRVLMKAIGLRPYQHLFFTGIHYDDLISYRNNTRRALSSIKDNEHLLVFSGIASPQQITTDLAPYSGNVTVMNYADHHQYTLDDMKQISRRFMEMPSPRIIITTEKDAARLSHLKDIPEEITSHLYLLPISIDFKNDKKAQFDDLIVKYVRTASLMKR